MQNTMRILSYWALLAATLPALGCSFVEAAGDITLGAEQKIPKVATQIMWPSADDLLGKALTGATGTSKAPAGLPTKLGSASLAHIQGLMTIDGECQRTVLIPTVESKAQGSLLRNLVFNLTNCGDPKRCVDSCQGFSGMKMEARIQFQLLDVAKAKKIKEYLSSKTNPDAIVQVRARFSVLDFFETIPGTSPLQTKSIVNMFADSQIGVSSEGGGDDTVVVEQRYLGKISPKTPQRFELDPRAEFTQKTKKAVILAEKPIWIEVFQRIWVPQKNLYSITLGGGGVNLDLQPEFVISALQVVKGALE